MSLNIESAQTENSTALEEAINKKIAEIAAVADDLPGVFIIHDTTDLSVRYMSPRGLKLLGTTLEELRSMKAEYLDRYFNPEDVQNYLPKIVDFVHNNTEDAISFFQQVRFSEKTDWTWHLSAMKVLLRADDGSPVLTVTNAVSIDPIHHVTSKVSRLLEENNFLRSNYHNFIQLGKRECEVLKFIALGKSSTEIAEELFISVATVDTHRRNIKKKLKITSTYELSLYARAFDLI